MEKIIHYCWFGYGEKPEIIKRCIQSWETKMPDWRIIEWNEENYDVNCSRYSKEAYQARRYAFVSDYARCKILEENGGIYLDTDVEILKSLEELVINHHSFMGFETDKTVAPGLVIAAEKGDNILKRMCDIYEKEYFIKDNREYNLKTIVEYTTEVLLEFGLVANGEMQQVGNFTIFPREYFAPIDVVTEELIVTPNTYTIHHYTASWRRGPQKWWHKFKSKIKSVLGVSLTKKMIAIKAKLRGTHN